MVNKSGICIDIYVLSLARSAAKATEDALEYALHGPAPETVVERPLWVIGRRRILPPQTITDEMDDAAEHLSIIHLWLVLCAQDSVCGGETGGACRGQGHRELVI